MMMNDNEIEIQLVDQMRKRLRFVSVLLCWDPVPGETMQYIIWKQKKPPFHWIIPKVLLVTKSEREAAINMLQNTYMLDTDVVTPPMDRYVQIYMSMSMIREVDYFLVKILDLDAMINIPVKFCGFSLTSSEVAIKCLQEDIDRCAVRHYDFHVVPKMVEAFSLIGKDQLRLAFTNTAKEKKKKQDKGVFKDKIVSISCLMSGKSLTDVMTSPKYKHPFSSETWHGAIKKLTELGISSSASESS